MVCDIVDMSKFGFIPGRQVIDNILLATDLIRGYTWSSISPRCMLKIDMAKAYDFTESLFLESVLKDLGFAFLFISWIMRCVTSISYSILINGIPIKPIFSKKGLRKGDPMSPIFFVIVIKYFYRVLRKVKGSGIKYHPKCKKTGTMKLMSADDLLILLSLLFIH